MSDQSPNSEPVSHQASVMGVAYTWFLSIAVLAVMALVVGVVALVAFWLLEREAPDTGADGAVAVAAKMGFLKKFWKLIVGFLAVVGGGIAKLFGRKKAAPVVADGPDDGAAA